MAQSKDFELALRVRAEMKQAMSSLRQLEQELYKTGTAGDKAGKEAGQAGNKFDKMGRDAATAETRMSRLGNAAKKAGSSFRGLGLVVAGAFAVHEVTRFTASMVEANTAAQRINYTFKQAFGSDAGKQLTFVTDLSKKLGLSLKETAESYGALGASAQGTGVQTEDLQKLFRGLSEAATVLHTPASELNATFIQLAQGISLGKLQMQDIRAISQHLPGTFSILQEAARRMGTTLEDALAHGGLDARKAIAAIGEVAHERFGVQAKEASHSLNAELNLLHSTLFQLQTDGTGFADTFAEAIGELVKSLNDPAVQQGIKNLINGLGQIVTWSVNVAAKMGDALAALKDYAEYAAKMQHGASGDDVAGLLVEKSDIQAELKQRKKMPVLSAINSFLAGTENNPVQNALEGGRPRIQAMSTDQLRARLRYIQSQLDRQKNRPAPEPAPDAPPVASAPSGAPPPLPPTTPPNNKAAQAAAARARAAVTANKQLRDTFIALQAAQDPVAAAWAKYNDVVAKATDAADKAKQATGANTEAIDGQLAAIKYLAAGARDAKLDEIAEKDRKAWEQFRASLQTPIEARVSDAVAAIDMLNRHMAKGKLSAAKYQEMVSRIFAKSVGVGPLRRVHTQGPGGDIVDQQSQEQSDFAHQMQLAQQVRDAILANDASTYEQRLAAQRAYQQQADTLAQIHAQNQAAIAQQKNQFALNAAQQGFGALANAAVNAYGAQSKQARAAFALQKAAAVASGILSIQQSIANSAKIGYPWNIVAIAGAVAQGAALIASIRSVQPGYAEGGYTGAGGKHQVAGVVHAGEVVWSQDDIARAGGVGMVEAWRRGLRGYADGGYVNPLANAPSPEQLGITAPSMPRMRLPAPTSPAKDGDNSGNTTHIHVWSIEEAQKKLFELPSTHKAIVHIVGDNPRAINGKWSAG